MWEAAAAFVHPGDVHIARGQIAGDLDVADKWSAAGDLPRIGPGESVVSGVADKEGSAANIKVVPGSVHSAVEGRRWVVIGPARLSIVVVVAVNAIMDPAIRV